MEAGGRRRRGQRLLYFFRTPPAVRVGREAIDAEAMRLLEQYNPDVSFDWGRLLKSDSSGSGSPGSRHERRRDRREQRRREQMRPSPSVQMPASPEAVEVDALEPIEPLESVDTLESVEPLESIDPIESLESIESRTSTLEPVAAAEPGEPEESTEPALPDSVELPERYARLGAEGLARLRARYADVAVRVAARPMADEERAELMARAEGLNPDAWTTADEVAAALEAYETVFESLRAVVGRRRRL
jgi:hypothetical protein